MNEEKAYLKNNPGKHKMNMFCSLGGFYKLESVNDKKVNDIDLLECVNIFGSDLLTDTNKLTIHNKGENWIVSKIKNLNYVKDNALVTMFTNSNGTRSGIINGYIDKSGAWFGYISKSSDVEGGATPHKIDYGLLDSLPQIFEEKSSVVDFGCGNADYVKHLIENGFECEAYDGNPDTPEMTDGIGKVLDLSEEFDLGKTFDYVMSLEVAEHIPKEFEETYVNNLIRHTGEYLITSWATVGQGGDGHVNEQDEDYVLNMYKEKGMVYNKEVSEALRNVATLGWFKNTIYVFEKQSVEVE
tara:strand:- start:2052 stop:2948 length:897 start_codon:yes stop_codon:yes gene_type:complete